MIRVNLLQRYIFREMLSPFITSLGVFTFILLLTKIIDLTDLVVSKGVGFNIVIQLLIYIMPYFLVFTIPMATLLSVLLTFLRLSLDNEITAFKASGISLIQFLPPVVTLAIIAWFISSTFALWALPWGNYRLENLIFQVARSKTDLILREKTFLNNFSGLIIYINRLINKETLQDIFIVDEHNPFQIYTIVAKYGKLYPMNTGKVILRLLDGTMNLVNDGFRKAQIIRFQSYNLEIEVPGGKAGRRVKKHEKEMYLTELLAEMRKNDPKTKYYKLLDMELQKKISIPSSCLVMAIIGLSLGVNIRNGRSWGVAIALIIFLFYYLMLSAAWSYGITGFYPPRIGMWVPNIVFGLLGTLMFYRKLKETSIPFSNMLSSLYHILFKLRK